MRKFKIVAEVVSTSEEFKDDVLDEWQMIENYVENILNEAVGMLKVSEINVSEIG